LSRPSRRRRRAPLAKIPAGAPEDEQAKIAGGNAARRYGFNINAFDNEGVGGLPCPRVEESTARRYGLPS